MSDRHHADPATLLGFASGTLEDPFRTVVACHLEACEACRTAVSRLEHVGGAELEKVEPQALTAEIRRLTLHRAAHTPASALPAANLAPGPDGLPRALTRRIDVAIDAIPWRSVGPRVGYWRAPERPGDSGALTFFRIANGGHIPEHGHDGREMTFILRGSYSDRFGRFGPGDIADFDEDVEHDPVADSEMPCICVAATEAPTKFKGVIGRILQPLVGI